MTEVIIDDNEAKEAIMSIILGRLDRDNEDREEKKYGRVFWKVGSENKKCIDPLNSRFLAINKFSISNETQIIRKIFKIISLVGNFEFFCIFLEVKEEFFVDVLFI